jgi:Rrf2 family protein
MISKATEYAIRALVYIDIKNREGLRPGYKEIAREIEAPEQYTAKVLQNIGRYRVLGSIRGRGGGFFLLKEASDISLLDVIRMMEGEHFFSKCGFGLKNCNNSNPCPLHEKYAPIRDGYYELVSTETIKSLADRIDKGLAVLKYSQEMM